MKSSIFKLGLVFPLLLASSYLRASDDSSAKAEQFRSYLEASTGAILRVPLNEDGEEMTSAAEMRIYTGEDLAEGSEFNLEEAWSQTVNVGIQEVQGDQVDDSSTIFFRFGWRPYRRAYYHSYYYPSYHYGNYGYYYRPYRHYRRHYGYGYYYYPRYHYGRPYYYY